MTVSIDGLLLANAYSAANEGDGLLVELSQQILDEVSGGDRPVTVIAVDPQSFPNLRVVGSPANATESTMHRAIEAVSGLVAPGRILRVRRAVLGSNLMLSVGGGYLRFSDLSEAVKTASVHLSQMRLRAAAGRPFALLPQSIGPLKYCRNLALDTLRAARVVYVRDDRSLDELGSLSNVVRMPDLAVLRIAQGACEPRRTLGGRVGLIARPLARPRTYEENLRRLVVAIGSEIDGLVQSTTGRSNDDRALMNSLGMERVRLAKVGLADPHLGVVVSTRLHGALQSIINGVPAIHLSYERKGFGAYADLGLPAYVHNARSFDAAQVVAQVEALRASPIEYFAEIRRNVAQLADSREQLVRQLRAVYSEEL